MQKVPESQPQQAHQPRLVVLVESSIMFDVRMFRKLELHSGPSQGHDLGIIFLPS